MCQLLGMNSLLPASLALSLSGFSLRGAAASGHADGWGAAFFDTQSDAPGKRVRCFIEDAASAGSPMAARLQSHPIKTHNAVAHVRRATVGPASLANSHPFARELWGRHWVFAHNGHLEGFDPPLLGAFRPVGATDSERAFCLIMEGLSRALGPSPPIGELTAAIHAMAASIGRHGAFNFLLSNGQALWARASTKLCYVQRSHPFQQIHMTDTGRHADLAALNGPRDRLCIVATEPLTSNEPWVHMEAGQLAVFADGALVQLLCA